MDSSSINAEIHKIIDGKARAEELEKMAKGCRDHAREIREFIIARADGVDAPTAAAGGM